MILDKPVNLEQFTREARKGGMQGPGHGATTKDGQTVIFCYANDKGELCVPDATQVGTDLCPRCKLVYTNHHALESVTPAAHKGEYPSATPARQQQIAAILLGLAIEQNPVADQTPRLVS